MNRTKKKVNEVNGLTPANPLTSLTFFFCYVHRRDEFLPGMLFCDSFLLRFRRVGIFGRNPFKEFSPFWPRTSHPSLRSILPLFAGICPIPQFSLPIDSSALDAALSESRSGSSGYCFVQGVRMSCRSGSIWRGIDFLLAMNQSRRLISLRFIQPPWARIPAEVRAGGKDSARASSVRCTDLVEFVSSVRRSGSGRVYWVWSLESSGRVEI